MTAAAESMIVSATAELRETQTSQKKQTGLLKELKAMGQAMRDEEGLVNHAQAALILDVSTRRIGELVETAKLRRFEFLGRTYVSVKEVLERRQSDIKGGRPPRNGFARVKKTVEIIANYDPLNFAVESLAEGGIGTKKGRVKK